MRRSLQIPADAVVIGHVGRFTESKNHDFWVSVAADIARLEPRAYFLLIGDGPMRPTVESLVRRVGLKARTKLLGSRPDVPELLLGAMDIMLFPSLYEGLPLALIEAQAAGLPCIISDNISPETDVIPELICRLPLDSQAAWTKNALLRLQRHGDRRAQPFTQQVASSQFSLDNCIQQLQRLYEGG
jgi:glycosyltransferase involved in cell wall biosynthesis